MSIICGQYWGKVRALINEEGKRLKEAGPSVAVKVLGLNGVPEAGLEFSVDGKRKGGARPGRTARRGSPARSARKPAPRSRSKTSSPRSRPPRQSPEGRGQGGHARLGGSHRRSAQEDRVRQGLPGSHPQRGRHDHGIRRLLASASKAIILGFHTRIDNGVAEVAKREGVQIKLYSIIYELIDQVKEAMAGLLDPLIKEVVVGSAEVRKIFELSKGGRSPAAWSPTAA